MAAEVIKPDFSYVWASGGAIVAPSDVKKQTGWTAEVPPFQWENWSQNRQDNAILHLFQKGISEWDALSNYYFTTSGVRSYVQGSNGSIYVAVADSLNQNPTTDATNTYWKLAFNDQGHGRCRLSVTSTTTLSLKPYNGTGVIVNGTTLQLPAGGVTYTISGLAVSTTYYVYLAGTTASPVLNLSTTAYVTGTDGVTVKSGDATQTLVGMVRTNASTQFVDSLVSRTCLNWFNRRNLPGANPSATTYTFTSPTPIEASTALRVVFLTWADDGVDLSISGDISSSASALISMTLYLDGVSVGPVQQATIQTNGQYAAFSSHNSGFYAEGLHTVSPFVGVPVGGATGTLQHVQTNVIVRG